MDAEIYYFHWLTPHHIHQINSSQEMENVLSFHVLKKPGEIENGLPEEIQEEARSSSSGSFEDVSGTQRPEIQAERQHFPFFST
jgi:hypothetical protein